MKHTGQCPKCGSTQIITDAKAVDRGEGNRPHEMVVVTYARPDAILFRQRQHTTVSAWVCAACGFMEFYADDPKVIEDQGQQR
jgi:predicted nucleic-acid-binding Zn-ribbon protein